MLYSFYYLQYRNICKILTNERYLEHRIYIDDIKEEIKYANILREEKGFNIDYNYFFKFLEKELNSTSKQKQLSLPL